MTDMYNAKGAIGGVIKGTTVVVTLSGDGLNSTAAKGALVQNISLQYSRGINRVWELGSDDTFYVIGHTQGQASMSQIVARSDADILDRLADACLAKNTAMTIEGEGDQCEGTNTSFSLKTSGTILTNRSFTINANDFLMNASAQLQFASLEKQNRAS